MSSTEKKGLNYKNIFLNFGEGFILLVIGFLLEFFDDKFTIDNKHIGFIVGAVGTIVLISRLISTEIYKENIQVAVSEKDEKDEKFKEEVKETLNKTQNEITRISGIIDIREDTKIEEIKKTLDLYLNITEREFAKVKDSIITETIIKLNRLKNNKRSDELYAYEYYEWLLPILEGVKSGESIKAVSCMFDAEWDDTPAEARFLQGNIHAAQNGATVERIFLMDKKILSDALKVPAVLNHTVEEKEKTKLLGFFADKEKVNKSDPNLLAEIGDGFIIFSSRVALIDKFDAAGQVRGIVTMNETDIRNLETAFRKLKYYSVSLSQTIK